jgi:penicillin-binding protein 1B
VIVCIACGDTLLKSYKYYARIVDARLASGYLTSRPGLYAAPRTLRTGQGLTVHDLTQALTRAGYVETQVGSNVWSGSFTKSDVWVEVRPGPTRRTQLPERVLISFAKDRISEITANGLTLESFTLEPETLTNDHSARTGRAKPLTYAELPPTLVQAILAIEDHRFFDHSGVDAIGLVRALVNNVSDEKAGQGGSTITQQLVKNTYLTPERTLRRKFAEGMLALALERRLSKQDIFALYCNEVYLGQRGALGARGVEQAANLYFGKELKALSLSEAATIAGMIQGPARYSPEKHPDQARARRNTVLNSMAEHGWITNEQVVAAEREPLTVVKLETSDSLAPYFIDYVNRVAEAENLSVDNSRLYTTIDLDLQRLAENTLKRQLQKLDLVYQKRDVKPQAALIALDPNTGNVLAMVGGRNYGESQMNRVTDAYRQPGSTFKPFVYAAALEDGKSPLQTFSDAPREFTYDRNRIYRPANYGGAYSMREVTMRTGLVKSLNVVTVDLAMQTGLTRIANFVERFGLPRPERYPAMALGTTEVTPLQLAAAYASFVNGGKRVTPRAIVSVAEPPATHAGAREEKQIVSSTTAYMITNMLADVVDEGTARAARNSVEGTAIAGKTGTSRDGWFVGYTPNLVCVVWIGFDDNSQLGLTGAASALPAWMEFVSGSVALRPELGGKNFECPEGIKFVEIDSENGMLSTLTCPRRELIAVSERVQPNVECFTHGNLPQDEDYQREVIVVQEESVIARGQSRKKDRVIEFQPYQSTRVDINSRGKPVLVNDLR